VITDAVHARGGRIIVIDWINGHRHDGSVTQKRRLS